MGVVKGTIALKDNATAVLQGIRKEQSAFRRDVEKTKSVLKATWDKKYQVRDPRPPPRIRRCRS